MSIDEFDKLPLRKVMSEPATIPQDKSIENVHYQLSASPSEIVGIVDDKEKLVGVATKTSVMKGLLDHGKKAKIEEAMYTGFISITDDKTVKDALQLMNEKKIDKLPVVDAEGRIVGVVSRKELLRKVGSFLTLRL